MVDWSATAAWITLVVTLIISIIAPIITTYMNHRFQLKLAVIDSHNKELEEHYLKKRAVIDSFISSTGKCIFRANSETLQECGEAFYSIYIYIPPSLWKDIDTLLVLIRNHSWETAQEHFSKLAKALAELLEESNRPNLHK